MSSFSHPVDGTEMYGDGTEKYGQWCQWAHVNINLFAGDGTKKYGEYGTKPGVAPLQ
jgi:hypothetical protein